MCSSPLRSIDTPAHLNHWQLQLWLSQFKQLCARCVKGNFLILCNELTEQKMKTRKKKTEWKDEKPEWISDNTFEMIIFENIIHFTDMW